MTSRLTGARWAALVAVVAASAALLPGIASADDAVAVAPPTEKITVDVVAVNGSGCPAGSATVTELADNTGFIIKYNSFDNRAAANTLATTVRKNCLVSTVVHIPGGFTFAIGKADYNGRVNIGSGSKALHRTNYYYQAEPENHYVDHVMNGPLTGTWRNTDIIEDAELVWAACGESRNLNINTELVLSAAPSTKAQSISMTGSDGVSYTLVNYQWAKC